MLHLLTGGGHGRSYLDEMCGASGSGVADQQEVDIRDGTEKLETWWLKARKRCHGREGKQLDAFVILICWTLWKQTNAHVISKIKKQMGPCVHQH
jgi:hypothetical protein